MLIQVSELLFALCKVGLETGRQADSDGTFQSDGATRTSSTPQRLQRLCQRPFITCANRPERRWPTMRQIS